MRLSTALMMQLKLTAIIKTDSTVRIGLRDTHLLLHWRLEIPELMDMTAVRHQLSFGLFSALFCLS
jgi:hypothetical protein